MAGAKIYNNKSTNTSEVIRCDRMVVSYCVIQIVVTNIGDSL